MIAIELFNIGEDFTKYEKLAHSFLNQFFTATPVSFFFKDFRDGFREFSETSQNNNRYQSFPN